MPKGQTIPVNAALMSFLHMQNISGKHDCGSRVWKLQGVISHIHHKKMSLMTDEHCNNRILNTSKDKNLNDITQSKVDQTRQKLLMVC